MKRLFRVALTLVLVMSMSLCYADIWLSIDRGCKEYILTIAESHHEKSDRIVKIDEVSEQESQISFVVPPLLYGQKFSISQYIVNSDRVVDDTDYGHRLALRDGALLLPDGQVIYSERLAQAVAEDKTMDIIVRWTPLPKGKTISSACFDDRVLVAAKMQFFTVVVTLILTGTIIMLPFCRPTVKNTGSDDSKEKT